LEHLNSQDQRLVGELRALIDTVEPGKDVLPQLVDALRDALHAERGIAFGMDVGPERAQASFTHISGFSLSAAEVHAELDGYLGSVRDWFGYFNPASPQPSQRNRVLQFRAPGTDEAPVPPPQDERLAPWKKLGITAEEQARMHARVRSSMGHFLQRFGLERLVHLRVLVCEGPALLGWVGVVRSEPFMEREVRLLEELTPALHRRLLLDTRLREAGLLHAALQATLEAIGQPAYVVTSTGRVAHANSAGQARLARDGEHVMESLRRHLRGEPTGKALSFTPLRLAGVPPHYLAIENDASGQASARMRALSASWGLTARETEVLERLVHGESNKAIAIRLGCAERTVEVHVTRILAKAQVESRSALIAKVFLAS
jgi:DNA-binding CsgD family transcriptional regulator/PAS domain-containing protein